VIVSALAKQKKKKKGIRNLNNQFPSSTYCSYFVKISITVQLFSILTQRKRKEKEIVVHRPKAK
jgi:hypothetical protein